MPLKVRGLTFSDICTPEWLERDPEFAWLFFWHQIELYRRSQPHAGFGILRKWAEQMPNRYFVFTSNVDGHFQKAGFDAARVVECHASLNKMQCVDPQVSREVWEVPSDFHVDVDVKALRAKRPLPVGPPSFDVLTASMPGLTYLCSTIGIGSAIVSMPNIAASPTSFLN